MISVIALKPSQDNNHSCQSNFKPVVQRIPQTRALDVSEKQKMQLSHSLGEPRPPGMPFRIRSKIASGPRSLETKWANLKVASAANTNKNQDIYRSVLFYHFLLLCIQHNSRSGACISFQEFLHQPKGGVILPLCVGHGAIRGY